DPSDGGGVLVAGRAGAVNNRPRFSVMDATCARIAPVFDPGGVADISRWSSPRDHRKAKANLSPTLKGSQKATTALRFYDPFRVVPKMAALFRLYRWRSTTG